MKIRKSAAVVSLSLAAALALSACGSSEETTSAGQSATDAVNSVSSAAESAMSGAEETAESAMSEMETAMSEMETAMESATGGAEVPAGDSKLLDSAADGKLVVGIKFDQPGLGQQLPDGTFAGFDVEVAKYVAEQMGVPADGIEFKEAKSAEREGLIERGEVDYIVATYSITDTRKEKVNFAGPYFVAGQDLLVKGDNTDITGPESLDGRILCSVTGSTPAQKVKDNYAATVALQEFGTYSECVEALRSGTVDAVTTDNVILAGYAAQFPGELKLVGNPFSEENYGIGLSKGDEAGTAALNTAIQEMIDSGAWETALTETVGPSGFTIPAPPTVG